jgi:hypothetical protein
MEATSSKTPADTSRRFLRHALATVAYRGGKALRGAPDTFAEFRASDSTRSPAQILAHIGDLYDWALSQAKGQEKWSDSKRRNRRRAGGFRTGSTVPGIRLN